MTLKEWGGGNNEPLDFFGFFVEDHFDCAPTEPDQRGVSKDRIQGLTEERFGSGV